jgi:hypothetical protein
MIGACDTNEATKANVRTSKCEFGHQSARAKLFQRKISFGVSQNCFFEIESNVSWETTSFAIPNA